MNDLKFNYNTDINYNVIDETKIKNNFMRIQ